MARIAARLSRLVARPPSTSKTDPPTCSIARARSRQSRFELFSVEAIARATPGQLRSPDTACESVATSSCSINPVLSKLAAMVRTPRAIRRERYDERNSGSPAHDRTGQFVPRRKAAAGVSLTVECCHDHNRRGVRYFTLGEIQSPSTAQIPPLRD